MTVVSKQLFYEKISKDVTCSAIHDWSDSCVGAHIVLFDVFFGALKFYLPIYIVKAILNHKKIKKSSFFKKLVIEELRSGLYGVLLAFPILSVNCILSKVCGRIHYYNLGIVSGLFSGLALLVESKENKILDTLIFFNLLIEAAFRNLDGLNISKITNRRQTLLFIAVSGLLMHLLQNRKKNRIFTNFWFYIPDMLQKSTRAEYVCSHKNSCIKWTLKGFEKYFLLGYGFSVIKKLIPRMLVLFQKPSDLLKLLISKENVKFATFIGAYAGVYRYVICTILRTKLLNPKYSGAIAGLAAGTTYILSPNLQVLCVAITTLLQILYNNLVKHYKIQDKDFPRQIVYMVSHCLLLHNAIMSKNTCPSYYNNMLAVCSGNRFDKIYDSLIRKYIICGV